MHWPGPSFLGKLAKMVRDKELEYIPWEDRKSAQEEELDSEKEKNKACTPVA